MTLGQLEKEIKAKKFRDMSEYILSEDDMDAIEERFGKSLDEITEQEFGMWLEDTTDECAIKVVYDGDDTLYYGC